MDRFRKTCLDMIFAVLRYIMERVLETKDSVHVYACMGSGGTQIWGRRRW